MSHVLRSNPYWLVSHRSRVSICLYTHQYGEKGVDVTPDGAEDPLLLDGRDEDAGEDAKGEDQIAQRHAKHQPAGKKRNSRSVIRKKQKTKKFLRSKMLFVFQILIPFLLASRNRRRCAVQRAFLFFSFVISLEKKKKKAERDAGSCE